MGKKKKRAAPRPTTKHTLPKTFCCPYCRAQDSVVCRFLREQDAPDARAGAEADDLEAGFSRRYGGARRRATIECKLCHKGYTTPSVGLIDRDIDVYMKWVKRLNELKRDGIYCPIGKRCNHKNLVLLRFDPEPQDEDEQRYVTVICDDCGTERIPLLRHETERQARERLRSNTRIRREEREQMLAARLDGVVQGEEASEPDEPEEPDEPDDLARPGGLQGLRGLAPPQDDEPPSMDDI